MGHILTSTTPPTLYISCRDQIDPFLENSLLTPVLSEVVVSQINCFNPSKLDTVMKVLSQ